jgi:uncharacterized protein YecT (DUF1311 family)
LRASLDPERFQALEKVQAAWLEYARAHCRWDGAFYEGGSLQPMIVARCMAALTQQRIRELDAYRCGKPSPPEDCP